jgi:phage replication initiation protein
MATDHSFQQCEGAERQADRAKLSAAAGAAPRTVIPGESTRYPEEKGHVSLPGALTDWLNVTFPMPESGDPLEYFFENFYTVAGPKFGTFRDRGRGIHRWSQSFVEDNGGTMIAFGGRNIAFLSLPGNACALVEDWDRFAVWLRDWCDADITRWDGAVDDFEGKRSVDDVVQAYRDGGFISGGRQPKYRQLGPWLEPTGESRTFYVGDRKNGKLYRAYEKGKKGGNPTSPWVRHEVEFHNRDRLIPWDVIWNPGKYVAGAYPYLRWVGDEVCRIRTIRETSTVSRDFLVKHCRRTYGPLINTLRAQGKSDTDIVNQLRRDGVPSRLAVSELLGIRPNDSTNGIAQP